MTQEEGAQWLEAHGWVKIGPDTKATPPSSFAQGWWYEPLDAYMMTHQGRWRVLFLDWVDSAESPLQAIHRAVDSVRNCADIFDRMTSDPPQVTPT